MAGDMMSAAASKEASDKAQETAKENMQMTQSQWDWERTQMQPFINAGQFAIGELQAGLQPGGQFQQKFQYEPGSDPVLAAQQQNLLAQGAASGNYFSGGMATALANSTAQNYNDAYNRYITEQNNAYQRLFGLTQLGSNQATAASGLGEQATQAAAQWNMTGAQAYGAGLMGIANAAKSGENTAIKTAGMFAGMCWVARVVYGEKNPRWLVFRYFVLNDAPKWFTWLYRNFGQRFAKFISNKPKLILFIRGKMDKVIIKYGVE